MARDEMAEDEMAEAVRLLAEARREGRRIPALNYTPADEAAGHAIQDRVAVRLGEAVGGFKANAPPDGPAVRGAIYARAIFSSPARVAPALVPDLAVEGEIAFRFQSALPARAEAYGREEVARIVNLLPAIEIVSGRLRDWRSRPPLEQLADCMNNGALVAGAEIADWTGLAIADLPVTAWVNGVVVWQGRGGHPIGDPLAVAVGFANIQRGLAGVAAGQIVTTGSCIGIRSLLPGDRFSVEFAGLGRAELVFEPG